MLIISNFLNNENVNIYVIIIIRHSMVRSTNRFSFSENMVFRASNSNKKLLFRQYVSAN